ncbi:porin family protein [Sulfurovum sp. XGS-02]|uniref:porin family protein n=1 Tax=Sulfurovum sp. XGS-02 TaxID=2925411 RepID=UPI00204830E1|nr:porin family protein [Sulfurovum sp. XGS-02]UPT77998.1 porin family protein [Sulfurovum sp. XGS-02]
MKKVSLSIVALLAMNTFAFAGGDFTTPVEPQVTIPEVDESTGSFYVGAGYTYINLDASGNFGEHDGDATLLLAGYNFNPYIGVEARYAGLTDCLENAAIYAKPMYPFGDIKVYALLGYGETTFDKGPSFSESGFQWGLGANYAVTENIGVFADYTTLYDDTGFDNVAVQEDVTVDAINVGVTYTF